MIVEHEFIEQILDEDWPLARSVSYFDALGKDGWTVLTELWRDGRVAIVASDGAALPDWRVREIFRTKNANSEVSVRCTDKGSQIV